MSSITLDRSGVLVYRTPYNPALVAALKAVIPYMDRKWDPQRKAWLVAPQHGGDLVKLTNQYLGENIALPRSPLARPIVETRLLDIRYIGATKHRGDGDRSAFGWVAGEWSAVFPEATLLSWFGEEPDPDNAPRMARHTTLYGALGIKRTVTEQEIRSAYRRTARQWHPDVCKEPDAKERFIQIQHAYEILSNAKARARYDAGLLLEATTHTNQQQSRQPFDDVIASYRPPLRCGLILAEGREHLGRFVVEDIIAWEDIVDAQGRVLVTSWPAGADTFMEAWV